MSEGHIKINPYAVSPRRAIRLMADICSGRPDVNVEYERQQLEKLVEKNLEKDWITKNALNFGNTLFFTELSKLLERLSFAVANDFFGNYKRVRVTLTGRTSSGKSSLINFLMKRSDLLPVDPDPSTILPTHIYCTNRRAGLKAYAMNHRNALIQVDLNAISGIQHTKASSKESMDRGLVEQISSTLSRFVVECPHQNFNNIEFIDSPGFDANKVDDEAAVRSLENTDVVLLLVDTSENMAKESLAILKRIKKPVLLVANCNNKLMTRQNVLDNFHNICENAKEFENVLDCVCISSDKPNKYGFFSRSGVESLDVFGYMENAINLLTSQVTAHTEIDCIMAEIAHLLKEESIYQKTSQKILEKERADINNQVTAKLSNEYIRHKTVRKEVYEAVASISEHNSVLKEDHFYERFCFLKDYYITSEKEKDNALSKLFELYTKRIEHCTTVIKRLDSLHKDIIDWYNSRKDTLGTERIIASPLPHTKEYGSPFNAIDNVYDSEQDTLVDILSEDDGFDVLKTFNETGHSLLTYSASRGNVPALKLIISSLDNGRLVREPDKEGRNILHAAAESGNISLFYALKEKFPRLTNKKDRRGRIPEELLLTYINKPSSI